MHQCLKLEAERLMLSTISGLRQRRETRQKQTWAVWTSSLMIWTAWWQWSSWPITWATRSGLMPSSGAQTKEVTSALTRGHLCHTHELKVKVLLDSMLKWSSYAPCTFTLKCPKIKALFQHLTLFELNPDARIVLNLSDHLAVPANDDSNSKSGHNHLDGRRAF